MRPQTLSIGGIVLNIMLFQNKWRLIKKGVRYEIRRYYRCHDDKSQEPFAKSRRSLERGLDRHPMLKSSRGTSWTRSWLRSWRPLWTGSKPAFRKTRFAKTPSSMPGKNINSTAPATRSFRPFLAKAWSRDGCTRTKTARVSCRLTMHGTWKINLRLSKSARPFCLPSRSCPPVKPGRFSTSVPRPPRGIVLQEDRGEHGVLPRRQHWWLAGNHSRGRSDTSRRNGCYTENGMKMPRFLRDSEQFVTVFGISAVFAAVECAGHEPEVKRFWRFVRC